MSEFDYQWKNLPTKLTEYSLARVDELLKLTGLPREFFKGKFVLDAGCGSGRYTYAMKQLGSYVISIDVSEEAIKKCREINNESMVLSIMDVSEGFLLFDFILSWGVLHHMEDPYAGFLKLVSVLKPGGTLHLMLYSNKTQKKYRAHREVFKTLSEPEKLNMAQRLAKKPAHVHGWYDALNPEYNHSYNPGEISKWFEDAGFTDINILNTSNININGKLG